ncbi:PLDc N-terminal domain-containing protein [Natronoarchaeum mannanilyticum]|uniref:Cardiolipin synthase N-terminal domain-containing protein n=1 Tax=Natronoarchaeum mannanilyticum TaxID=926360 RepID=A0AAV3TC13_9EURY
MPAGGAVALIGVLMFALFAIVIPFWVYNDAEQNSSHSALLWALVAFFGGILGLLLYLLIGRDRTGGSGGRGGQGVGSGPGANDGWNDRNDGNGGWDDGNDGWNDGNDGWGDDADDPEVRR